MFQNTHANLSNAESCIEIVGWRHPWLLARDDPSETTIYYPLLFGIVFTMLWTSEYLFIVSVYIFNKLWQNAILFSSSTVVWLRPFSTATLKWRGLRDAAITVFLSQRRKDSLVPSTETSPWKGSWRLKTALPPNRVKRHSNDVSSMKDHMRQNILAYPRDLHDLFRRLFGLQYHIPCLKIDLHEN